MLLPFCKPILHNQHRMLWTSARHAWDTAKAGWGWFGILHRICLWFQGYNTVFVFDSTGLHDYASL